MPPVTGRTASAGAVLALLLCLFPRTLTATELTLPQGRLLGDARAGISHFLGIPYAAAPVGARRWQPPGPAPQWRGSRDATHLGAQCLQTPYPAGSPYLQVPAESDEDCLFLNVWTPALPAAEPLPVMVWIHGGNFTRGSGGLPVYNGRALAARGVVVVTFNYRLNVFGYLAHPALSAEQGGHSGNYGLMDQIAALQWVQDNIAHFGGDPARVTVFGESAGSSAVNQILATPGARGLVQGAIGQSGAFFMKQPELEDGYAVATQLAARLGANSLDRLRDVPAADLLAAFAELEATGVQVGPVVDGALIPDQLLDLYEQGEFARVPTLLGYNRDEATSFALYPDFPGIFRTQTEFEEGLWSFAGPAALPLIWAYPEQPGSQRPYLDFWRDAVFGWNMQTWAQLSEAAGQSAWLYFFTHAPNDFWGEQLGAYHAAEIPFVFGNKVPSHPEDLAVRELVQSYWVNFARTGNPNGEGLPRWPSYSDDAHYLELNSRPRAAEDLSWLQLRLLDLLQAAAN
ncbi:MAG: carboxylesterase family protein [Halieaceae bacterium]|nr:carboxylesterase family protein [Halieaceae bacterium]